MRFAASASFDSVRPQIVTAAPSAARRSAQARPMPVPPPVTRTAMPSRPPEGRVRCAIVALPLSVADALGALAEAGRLLVDERLQRRAAPHAVEEGAQPREAPALGCDARVAQVDVRARDREVGDRELRADEELALAELPLEVGPEAGDLLVDRLLRRG